jgi:hypothetical protein
MMDTVALTKGVKEVYAKHGFTLIEMDTRSLTTEVSKSEILKRCFDALKIDGGLAAVLVTDARIAELLIPETGNSSVFAIVHPGTTIGSHGGEVDSVVAGAETCLLKLLGHNIMCACGKNLTIDDDYLWSGEFAICRECFEPRVQQSTVTDQSFLPDSATSLATIIKYEQNLIPVTKGSADAIAQMMESLQLKKAWIKMLCINETELDKSVLVRAKAVIRTGKPELKGDIQKMRMVLKMPDIYIVIIDMNGKNGVVLKRTGKNMFSKLLDGFDAMNKLFKGIECEQLLQTCQ